jgi:formamidopyrimidine-DNA glycosylase
MPELPDLEIIREVLTRHIVGQRIEEAEIVRPLVVRPLDPTIAAEAFLTGQTIEAVARRGKFLLFALSDGGQQPST